MKRINLKKPVLLLFAMLVAVPAMAATYDIDPSHSSVSFKVKHLAISNVKGSFTSFNGTFDFEPGEPGSSAVEASIDLASVDTGNGDRDDHLRNADFFDVKNNPTMVFKSTGVKMDSEDEGKLMGTLTLNGKTLPVTLDLEVNGTVTDPWGNDRAGFSVSGKIDRRDWGLTYGKAMESGGLVIGHDVKITLEVEGIKKK